MHFKMLLAILCLTFVFHEAGFAASFDCGHASRVVERTICADAELSKADEEMAKYYVKLKESLDAERSQELLSEQRVWLKWRTDKCAQDNSSCLKKLYYDRIHALRVKCENLVPFVLSDPGSLQGLTGMCAFTDLTLPDDLYIYAAGAHSGRKLNVQIDQSGHQATQFDVVVNTPEKPTVLLLGAYEPSIWNIGWTKGTKVLAVLASGYHRQAVSGLPKETPIIISTYDNKGPCGYTYVSKKTLSKINPLSKRVFGKPVDMVYFAAGGKVVVGASVRPGEELFTSRDIPPDTFIDKTKPLAGRAGIQDAVTKGLLRPATQEDAEAWANRKAKLIPKDALPPVSGGDNFQALMGPYGHNVFVILKPFQLPSGLYGGNSATFYLLDGVPYPVGDLGHSSLYDFNTMTCRGPRCPAP
jgi:uncharacterized protein YecT (DUF1311 family)